MAVGYTTRQPQRAAPTDHLSTHEGHDASSLGEPLVPADGHSQLAVLGVPHLEATVAGVEVELLLVAGTIGNVGLSVHAKDLTIGIDDGNGVVVGLVVLLEEGDGSTSESSLATFWKWAISLLDEAGSARAKDSCF